MKAQGGVAVQSFSLFNLSARWGWGGGMVSTMPQPLYAWERDLVPILQEAGWAPEPEWTGVENLAATGIQSPN